MKAVIKAHFEQSSMYQAEVNQVMFMKSCQPKSHKTNMTNHQLKTLLFDNRTTNEKKFYLNKTK